MPRQSKSKLERDEDDMADEKYTEPLSSTQKAWACCTICIPARYVLCLLSFLGFFNAYAMRVNLSVALVAMINHSAVHINATVLNSSECEQVVSNSSHEVLDGPFVWSTELQGIILGAFFYGYIFTQIPGGWLAGKFGGKYVFLIGILVTSVLTLLIPRAAVMGPGYLIGLRVLIGLAEGGTIPAMHAMWGRWAPPLEHSKLGTFCYSGMMFGTFVSLPVCGVLAEKHGWESVFYVFGCLGCVWCIVWWLCVYDTPRAHPYISRVELDYIENSIFKARGHDHYVSPPWKSMCTSLPFLSIVVAHTCNNWGYYTLLMCLPEYMADVQKFDVKKAGFVTALPYLIFWVISNLSANVADVLRNRRVLRTKNVRKIWCCISFGLPAFFLTLMGQVKCDHNLALVFLTLAVGMNGFHTSSFLVNHLDLAPRFAGVMMGITNTFATVPGMLGPIVVGVLTNTEQTSERWAIVFYISAAVFLVGMVFFAFFSDGEEQAWNRDVTDLVADEKLATDSDRQRLISHDGYCDELDT